MLCYMGYGQLKLVSPPEIGTHVCKVNHQYVAFKEPLRNKLWNCQSHRFILMWKLSNSSAHTWKWGSNVEMGRMIEMIIHGSHPAIIQPIKQPLMLMIFNSCGKFWGLIAWVSNVHIFSGLPSGFVFWRTVCNLCYSNSLKIFIHRPGKSFRF